MASPDIILQHLKELARGEIKRQRDIQSLYKNFRLALYDALGVESDEIVKISSLGRYRREIDLAIDDFAKKLRAGLDRGLLSGAKIAVSHASDEIKVLQKGIGAKYVPLNIRASVVISRAEKLLLSQYESSVGRYSEHLRGRIGQILSQAALKNSTLDQVTKQLAGQRGLISAESYQVERIARTEYLRAYNIGRNQSTREAKRVLPDLKRRWDATLDSRTCDICGAADGQIAELDKPFKVHGVDLMTPQDSHPNCRCAETPYREAWKEYFDN